jgi:hypothetical protein
MNTFTVPVADLQMERAVALAQQHCLQLEEMWRRNRAHGADLVGALRSDEDGSWFVGMNERRELLDQSPALLEHFPQLDRPAWCALPHVGPGTAFWLIVGEPPCWTCMRMRIRDLGAASMSLGRMLLQA